MHCIKYICMIWIYPKSDKYPMYGAKCLVWGFPQTFKNKNRTIVATKGSEDTITHRWKTLDIKWHWWHFSALDIRSRLNVSDGSMSPMTQCLRWLNVSDDSMSPWLNVSKRGIRRHGHTHPWDLPRGRMTLDIRSWHDVSNFMACCSAVRMIWTLWLVSWRNVIWLLRSKSIINQELCTRQQFFGWPYL